MSRLITSTLPRGHPLPRAHGGHAHLHEPGGQSGAARREGSGRGSQQIFRVGGDL